MKPTDEERREVASEMRQRGYEGYYFVVTIVALELGIDFDDYGVDYDSFSEDAWNRLADLIEPAPERTCRDLGGEDGTVFEHYDFGCSECGFASCAVDAKFCPECGARVTVE